MTGAELRTLRRRLDMTQDVFASRLGVTRMTVYRWEHRGVLPLKIVRMITRAAAAKPARAPPAVAVEHVTRASGDAQAVTYAMVLAPDVAVALQRLADDNHVDLGAYANAVLRGHVRSLLPPQFTGDPWS